ncbi:DinB family protein [candidate division WOR-3 bacterium]|nr:DinB family protein [candidate division WOR-3 bacterium]
MSEWNELAHFLYGKGFWYADALREIRGLTEEQLYWVPDENSLPIIWQVGHIAHRECTHISYFLERGRGGVLRVPERYEVFGTEWRPLEHLHKWIESIEDVFAWVKDVREKTYAFIDSLKPRDFHKPAPGADDGLSIAHWLFITTCHTALHIGRIQALRAMIENAKERAC